MSELDVLQRRFARERVARKEAEILLEEKSREVFAINQRLKNLAEQTRAIVETAADGIVIYGEDGRIHSLNRSARLIFNREDCSDLEVNHLFQLDDESPTALFPELLPMEAESTPVAEPVEVVGIRASGETFASEVAVNCLLLGESKSFTALVRDLSRRKKLEESLRQAQKMESIGQMAAGIAHEINTPIQFIGSNLEFLDGAFGDINALFELFRKLTDRLEDNSDSRLDALLGEIESQCEVTDLAFLRAEFPGAIEQSRDGIKRVATIVQAMKEFSQQSSGEMTEVDINHVIENTLVVSASLYRGIAEVELDLGVELPRIRAIEPKLNQTILNIVANAAEAIEEGTDSRNGHIRISTKRIDDCVEVRIQDNGVGIPTEIQNRIFDPFFTTKDVGKGTGQGLAFVYDVVVNKHGGDLRVASSADNGTVFSLSLPITGIDFTGADRQEYANSIG